MAFLARLATLRDPLQAGGMGTGEEMLHDVTLRGPPAVQLANRGPQRAAREGGLRATGGRVVPRWRGPGCRRILLSFNGRAGSFALPSPHKTTSQERRMFDLDLYETTIPPGSALFRGACEKVCPKSLRKVVSTALGKSGRRSWLACPRNRAIPPLQRPAATRIALLRPITPYYALLRPITP